MNPRIEMALGDAVAEVELYQDKCSRTVEAFMSLLPFGSTVNHAKVAGAEFFCFVPMVEELESPVVKQATGNLGYYPLRQTLCVFYEDMPGAGQVTPLGRIVTNLDAVIREGLKAWQQQGAEVRFREMPGE